MITYRAKCERCGKATTIVSTKVYERNVQKYTICKECRVKEQENGYENIGTSSNFSTDNSDCTVGCANCIHWKPVDRGNEWYKECSKGNFSDHPRDMDFKRVEKVFGVKETTCRLTYFLDKCDLFEENEDADLSQYIEAGFLI